VGRYLLWLNSPTRAQAASLLRFRDRHTTLGRNPLEGGSASRRDLYLTKHNIKKRQTSMPSAGFEPKIPALEWPQTHALERTAAGTGNINIYLKKFYGPTSENGFWIIISIINFVINMNFQVFYS
jgi:hypothetical protein